MKKPTAKRKSELDRQIEEKSKKAASPDRSHKFVWREGDLRVRKQAVSRSSEKAA